MVWNKRKRFKKCKTQLKSCQIKISFRKCAFHRELGNEVNDTSQNNNPTESNQQIMIIVHLRVIEGKKTQTERKSKRKEGMVIHPRLLP